MNNYIAFILIGIALSMDTFALSISIGAYLTKFKLLIFSILVGIFHFILPILGTLIGSNILNNYSFNPSYLLGIVLLILLIQMILDLKNNNQVLILNMLELIILSLTVSIDSFITGIGLSLITNNIIFSSIIFSIISFTFTIVGLNISKLGSKYLGIYSKYLGILILAILVIKCFIV